MKIDIGGGTTPQEGYVNLDPVHGDEGWTFEAQHTPWPVEYGTVDAVYASHVLEHIPAGRDRIAVFNEVWRVLKQGGTFTIKVPLVGYTDMTGEHHFARHWGAWADPTHVSHWWFPESLHYFYGDSEIRANADYRLHYWNLGSFIQPDHVEQALLDEEGYSWWSVINGWEGVARLQKTTAFEVEDEQE